MSAFLVTRVPTEPNSGRVARYQYGLAFLHPDGANWTPFPGGPALYQLCDIVAAQTSRFCRPLVAGPDLVERLRKSAVTREAFVVVSDLSSAEGQYKDLLSELNDAGLANFALFVVPGEAKRVRHVAGPAECVHHRFPRIAPHPAHPIKCVLGVMLARSGGWVQIFWAPAASGIATCFFARARSVR